MSGLTVRRHLGFRRGRIEYGVAKIKIPSNGDLVIAGGFYGSLTLGAIES